MFYLINNIPEEDDGLDRPEEDIENKNKKQDKLKAKVVPKKKDNIEIPPTKFAPKLFEKISCDIVKETEDIIKKMEELGKNEKEELKFETYYDLIIKYHNNELEEKLKIKEVEEKNFEYHEIIRR